MFGRFGFRPAARNGKQSQAEKKKQPSARGRTLTFEWLETRNLLSASAPVATPTITLLPFASGGSPSGYTPTQIRHAYGFDQVTFGTTSGNGSGQTIAIVDAYNDPNIASDLATFDKQFGLAAPPNFKVVSQSGNPFQLPKTDSGWGLEISLDVEWAHAIAPGANILLVEASSSSLNDLLTAVNYAKQQAGVATVSMSWGTSEFSGEAGYDSTFTTPAGHSGVTFVASSGDSGSPAGWPAISNNVLSVGGTALNLSGSNYSSETAWSGSTGGTSTYESEPSYQLGVQSTGRRTNPDVAYDASPNTGVAVYDSLATGGQSGWFQVGGTSAGAPQWAGLIAVADQGLALKGLGALAGAQSTLYTLPSADFHDITSGSNGGYRAGVGYDEVTGLGSPVANLVIQNLVNGVSTSSGSGSSGSSSGSGGSSSGGTTGGSTGGTTGGGSSGGGTTGGGGSTGGGTHRRGDQGFGGGGFGQGPRYAAAILSLSDLAQPAATSVDAMPILVNESQLAAPPNVTETTGLNSLIIVQPTATAPAGGSAMVVADDGAWMTGSRLGASGSPARAAYDILSPAAIGRTNGISASAVEIRPVAHQALLPAAVDFCFATEEHQPFADGTARIDRMSFAPHGAPARVESASADITTQIAASLMALAVVFQSYKGLSGTPAAAQSRRWFRAMP